MERVRTAKFGAEIGRALEFVPPPVAELIGPVHFFEGNIFFAGAWSPRWSYNAQRRKGNDPAAEHLMSCWSPQSFTHRPADQRVCTVDAPRDVELPVTAVLHELGHALMYALGRGNRALGEAEMPHIETQLSPYAMAQQHASAQVEQFAEAVAAWLIPRKSAITARGEDHPRGVFLEAAKILVGPERGVLAFLNDLAGWPADRRPRCLQEGLPDWTFA